VDQALCIEDPHRLDVLVAADAEADISVGGDRLDHLLHRLLGACEDAGGHNSFAQHLVEREEAFLRGAQQLLLLHPDGAPWGDPDGQPEDGDNK
jgi:hypothetical protein